MTGLAALAVLLAGCGGAAPQGPGGPGGGAPPVTVATPLAKPIIDWDDYVGRFEAVQAVEIRPRVSGMIEAQHFRDGQFVRAGDLLFTIDPRPFAAALAQAQAQAARAKANAALAAANFARSDQLFKANALGREEQETAQASAEAAAADLAAAQATVREKALDLEFTRVTAPIGGRLSDRRVVRGAYVAAGQTVLTSVVSMDPIHFVFTGSEAVYLKYSRANQAGTRPSSRVAPNPVDIRLADETGYRWHGTMDFVDNALDMGTGTIRGRAVVRNPDGFLTPGMFGHMRLLGSGSYRALLIPEEAVITDQTRKSVLVVGKGNQVEPRVLQLGPLVDGLRVVRSGLKADDRVIIAGVQLARPGMKVTPRAGKVVAPAPGTGPQVPAIIEPPATQATAAS
jgi:RND family efflux transporter MFP subunit